MSDTKVKIIDVKTVSAVKSVEKLTSSFIPLKKQIRDLQNELGQLEKGSTEYEQKIKELSDLQQRQIEINEAAKYSNQDFGATMNNLTKISLGLQGGINALSASMSLLGEDSEELQKSLAKIQLVMGVIQSFAALDTAGKALRGLKVAFLDMGKSATTAAVAVGALDTAVASATVSETKLASTTTTVTAATTTMGKSSKGLIVGLKGITNGIKTASKAFKAFIVSNPILLAISVAIGAVVAAITIMNKKMQEAGKIANEEADIISNVNNKYDEQNVRLNVLLKTAQDENESLSERKKAVEELNKIVPEYNAKINETTGAYEASSEALDNYMQKMKQRLLLEAYEGKIKELLQEQIKLEEKANKLMTTGWFNTQQRVNKIWQQMVDLNGEIDHWYDKIKGLDLSKALDDNKVEKTTNKVKENLKKIEESLKETKKIMVDFWDVFYQANVSKRRFIGPVNDLQSLINEMNNIIHKYDFTIPIKIGGENYKAQFQEEFVSFLKYGIPSDLFDNGFDFSKMFKNTDVFDKLGSKTREYANKLYLLKKYYEDLKVSQGGELTEKQTKEYEERKKNIETTLNGIQNQINGYNELIDTVYEYSKKINKLKEDEFAHTQSIKVKDEQLKIEKQYYKDIYSGNYLAEINKTLATEELEIDTLKESNERLKERKRLLEENSKNNGLYAEEITEINRKIEQNERDLANKELQIDRDKYNKRTQILNNYYELVDNRVNKSNRDLENSNLLWGGGTASVTTALQQQQAIVNSFQEKQLELDKLYYEQKLISEEEYFIRSNELKKLYNQEQAKLDDIRIDTAIASFNAYYNAYNSLTNAIGNILDQEMSKYDENSEEYKKLAVAKGITDTISGSLAAFMSGVQSGIPAPYNMILAAVLASATAAVGASQIGNIKKGNLSGAGSTGMTSGAMSVGQSQYETMVYSQNSDILSTIKDQKVYVTETDITKTQKKVAVREYNSSF